MLTHHINCIQLKQKIQEELHLQTSGNIDKLIELNEKTIRTSKLWKHFTPTAPR